MKNLFYIVLISLLTSCAAIHNVPTSQNPNNFIQPNTTSSFVDQNGNFYPDNWLKTYGNPPKNAGRRDYSLMKIATENNFQNKLTSYEYLRLKNIEKRDKQHILKSKHTRPKKKILKYRKYFYTK